MRNNDRTETSSSDVCRHSAVPTNTDTYKYFHDKILLSFGFANKSFNPLTRRNFTEW